MHEKRGLTPGGYRDPDAIYQVLSGQRLHRTARGHEIRDKTSGSVLQTMLSHSASDNRGPKFVKAPEPGAAADGWQAYVDWTNTTGTPINLLQASWTVPPFPADTAEQTVFLFPGIENIAGDVGILQPVLQWGVSHIGGGPYWTVASWYVPTTGEAYYSNELVRVNPNQLLSGVMRIVPRGSSGTSVPGTYDYDCLFAGIAGTDLSTGDLPELTWANLTLEAYGIQSRSQYPTATLTTYAAVNVAADPGLHLIPWIPVIRTGAFGESANPVNKNVPGGRVDIVY